MKNKIQPTQKERIMRDDDFIVTKTDLKGRITYANKIFVEFSGYTQEQLWNQMETFMREVHTVFDYIWDDTAGLYQNTGTASWGAPQCPSGFRDY